MKKTFLIIVVVIVISVILYGVFAFAAWELNPKYWDAFLRGVFSILLIIINLLCGVEVCCEVKD